MSDPEPSRTSAVRRPAGRWLPAGAAAAAGIAIAVCLLPPLARADTGTGASGGLVVAARSINAPATTADSDRSEVSFRVVVKGGGHPPPPAPPMANTGLDMPVFAMVGGAAALIALGVLVIARGSASRRRKADTAE